MSALNSTIGFSSIKSATNCRKFLAEPAVLDPAEVMNARCLIGGRGGGEHDAKRSSCPAT